MRGYLVWGTYLVIMVGDNRRGHTAPYGLSCSYGLFGLSGLLRLFIWFVLFVLFIWLNQTNRINQMNQTDWACPRRAGHRSSAATNWFFRRLLVRGTVCHTIDVDKHGAIPAQSILARNIREGSSRNRLEARRRASGTRREGRHSFQSPLGLWPIASRLNTCHKNRTDFEPYKGSRHDDSTTP